MSGLARRIKRNRFRANAVSGYKGGENLSSLLPTENGESWPTKVRRWVRLQYQIRDMRRKAGRKVAPPGMIG